VGFEGFPFIVGWELTLACNMRCRHCASAAGLPRPRELALDEALRVCDQFPDLAVQEVHFTGGEPLVRPDWWRIAQYVHGQQIATRMVSNGLLLTPDNVARIAEVGLTTVAVSLDGLEDTHDRIRACPGLFRRVMAGMERVAAAGIRVSAITAVNPLNLGSLAALQSLLESAGVDTWQLQPNLPHGRSLENRELHLSDEQFVELNRFFREAHDRSGNGHPKVVPADSLGYFTELQPEEPPWRGCAAGLASVGIRSDGRVTGCLSMPDEIVEGDLRERDLWDIWFDENAFPYSRRFSVERLGPACRDCDRAGQCKGGCSSMSYGCTGRFHNDPYCLYAIKRRNPGAFAAVRAIGPESSEWASGT
jgi:radical SAM protein with 4Fe4S-binding SPASM domain